MSSLDYICPATMRGAFRGLTRLALGEAVPCRPGGTTAEAYKRSKGTNTVTYPALALQKLIVHRYKMSQSFWKCWLWRQWQTAAPPPLPQLKKLWHPATVGFRLHRSCYYEGASVLQA